MGLMDELKKLTRPYNEEDMDEYDYDEEEDDLELLEDDYRVFRNLDSRALAAAGNLSLLAIRRIDNRQPRCVPFALSGHNPYRRPRRSSFSAPETPAASTGSRRSGPAKVVNLSNNTSLQVVLVKPDRFDTVSEIADNLRDKKAIVLNLESTNKDVARRLVDFLSGVAYALDGKIKKVAISTYILTPYNVEIVGDLVEELENSGVYF